MRTIFEDTTLKAEMEESRSRGNERKSTLPVLWLIALLFLGSVWGVYRWADSRPALTPPPPPVSLDDTKQTGEFFSKFNRFLLDAKWSEAEAMLSTTAKQRLTNEQKGLPEGLFGKYKDYKVVGADIIQGFDRTIPETLTVNCLYKFTDNNYTKVEERIIPLTLIIENGKLVIDSWLGVGSEGQKEGSESKAAVNK
ncbi:MAG: hypothetical protein ACREA2_18155 [Blastocatellia bacterium]